MKKFELSAKRPLIIAGPCSAETEEQTIETCTELAKTGVVALLRAGIWKPRTNPGSFEGVGEVGLEWMVRARELTGLPIAAEVASAKHVESALKHSVDVVWIGARTTVSPFATQDVADALAGNRDVTVMIKNPVNPDVALWAGAVHRFQNAGIPLENIALIHRGFSYFGHSKYRNAPMWHLALEMRNLFPDMALICDPSHICGSRDYIKEVAQTAADMRFDGLIMESHICPAQALSDVEQQLTPADLAQIVRDIKWRKDTTDDAMFIESLHRFRQEIDQIDSEVYELLSRRMRVAESIGGVKFDNNVAILQEKRWRDIVERVVAQADKLGLSEEFLRVILAAIHTESISRQNSVMNSRSTDKKL